MIEKIFSSPSYDGSKFMMDVAVMRQEIFSSNLGNIETPGFKRLELSKDFGKVFADAMKAGKPASIQMPSVNSDLVSPAQRMDGNNVVLQDELLAMGKNTAEYEALSDFVSGSMRTLRMAIQGRSSV
jgi:flagellar basal-body rod protein FlgB